MAGSRLAPALGPWLRRHWHLLAVPACCLLYVAWVISLPAPDAIATVSAEVERIEFTVHDPRLASFPVGGMRIVHQEAHPGARLAAGECISGLLRPDLGAIVAYELAGRAPLTVSIEQGGAVHEPPAGGAATRVSAPFVLEEASKQCGAEHGEAPHRLPIRGDLRIGVEMRPAARGRVTPGLLLEGKLRVQVRALHTLHVGRQPSTLYSGPEIELAAGARVQADAGRRPQTWFGTALVPDDAASLRVLASTEAPNLLVFRPGRTDPDVIRITALTQVFEDPNVVRLQMLVLGVIAIIALFVNLFALTRRP